MEADDAGSWSDVFKDSGISGFTRVAIASSANFCQQPSRCRVMSSLGPYVFQNSIWMSRKDAMLVSGGLQVFYFLSSLIPWYAPSMQLHDFLGLYGINTILKMILTAYSGLTSVQLNEALGFGQRIPLFTHLTKQSKAKFSQHYIADSRLNRCFGLQFPGHFVEMA
jgi:hypothetical protein